MKARYTSGALSVMLSSEPYYINSISGLGGVRGKFTTTKGMNQDGYIVTSQSLEDRDITVNGCIRAISKENLEIYKQRLLKLFNPKGKGTLEYSEGGINRKIEVIVESAPVFSSSGVWRIVNYTTTLVAPQPFFQDVEQQKVQIALWKGAFQFPLMIPKGKGIIMGFKDPALIVNVYNKGDVETGMRIVFRAKGVLTNPSLFNVETREFIKINKAMTAGEVITIDTNYGKKGITLRKNGVESNILNYIDIAGGGNTFLQLTVGDNLLRYNADTGADNLEVDIYYDNRYLGV